MSLSTLTGRVLAFRDARNWAQFHKHKDMAISLMLEAAELAEHFQWKSEEEIRVHVETKRSELSDELSDVLYWVLLMAHDMGINLEEGFESKMKKNEAKYPVEKARDSHRKYTDI